MSDLQPIEIIQPLNGVNTATVIFLPGTGQTSTALLEMIKRVKTDFALPHVKFIVPTAPLRPYIPYKNQMTHVWFNRNAVHPSSREHLESIEDIKPKIMALIKEEIDSGIPLKNIIIGGFSMGGAMALYTAYHFMPGFAACFPLSAFLNDDCLVYNELQAPNTPFLMYQGDRDTIVRLEWAENTFNKLTVMGLKGDFHVFKDDVHDLQKEELDQLLEWITKILPPSSDM